jgi:hypothetical protein
MRRHAKAITEQFLLVVDKMIILRDGSIVIIVASLHCSYHTDKILHLSGSHPLCLFLLNVWIKVTGDKEIRIGRQLVCVLINARII